MRVRTGIFGLDELLGGGYRLNTVNAVLGSTGVGKTIFSLQFILKGLEEGEKCIFVSFDMDEDSIISTAESIGWDLKKFIDDKRLSIGRFYVEDISYLNSGLMAFILDNLGERTRIAIDSFTPLVTSLSYEMRNDVNWFFQKLRSVGTTVITLEEPLDGSMSSPSLTIPIFLSDSLIHLKRFGYGEAFDRTLKIVKHRGSWHAEGVFPYKILKGLGIVVDSSYYLERSKAKLDLNSVLKSIGVSKRKISKELLEKIEIMLSEELYHSKDEIIEILKRVIRCYQK